MPAGAKALSRARSRGAARPAGARALLSGWRGAAAAGLAALLVCACATVPDSGSVRAGRVSLTAGGQGQDYLQLIPAPPEPGWSPAQVVRGFLTACASFASRHAIARQYLAPAVREKWDPGWAVTVVGAIRLGAPQNFAHQPGPYAQMAAVNVTGEKLATLTATGQYLGTQGPTTSRHQFQLEKTGGQWRIENPPSRLLLAEPDFQRVYAPRNLYYVASSARALVPDPVFVPLQATPADLAGKLVTALLQNPEGWLASGVSTSFPRGATLRRVVLNDGTATIDLGGRAARATQENLNDMASQLVWTLAGPSYGQSVIRSVRLEVNGRPRLSASMSGGQSRPDGGSGLSVPTADKNVPLYAVAAATGAVQALTGPAREARTVPGEAGEGQLRLTTIAASPRGHYVAGISRSGKVVYYGRMQRGAGLTAWRPYGASAASLSWDVRGDLWVASSNGLWMLTPGTGSRMQVVPVGLSLRNGSEVSQLRVAPDGVRVAMIVHGPGGRRPRLLLAAIIRGPGGVDLGPAVSIGTDVSHPTQLTWYDADNLIVLSRSLDGPQLHEVAVNGSSAVPITTDAGTQSVTAAGRANPIVAGLAHGQLGLESSLNGAWAPRGGAFLSPVYPG